MFVQVVRGVVTSADAAFARLDDWSERLAPTAPGWLGTTAGVTRDSELVAFVRFASTADARMSSDRVEQGMWWAESAVVFSGDVTFDNYEDVTIFGDGGSDRARLVQVVLGRVHRPHGGADLVRQLARKAMGRGAGVIGGLVGLHDDGHLTQAVYFADSDADSDAASDDSTGSSRDPRQLLGTSTGVAELRLLRLQRIWFGSPGTAPTRTG